MLYVLLVLLSILNVMGLIAIGLFSLVMFLGEIVHMVHTPEVKKMVNFTKALFILLPSLITAVTLICLDGNCYRDLGMTCILVFASWMSYEWYMFISYLIFHADVNGVVKGKPTWSIDVARKLHLVR